MSLQVVEAEDGVWNVVDGHGSVLASEASNAAAWKAVERLEVRERGRLSALYLSDAAVTVRRKEGCARALSDVVAVYEGSNGDATKAMYVELEAMGPIGMVAVNLFRASKTSGRAKDYRGRRYKNAAYDTKQWSIDNLVKMLSEHASALGIAWGWGEDPKQEFHRWVLYVDTPKMRGQVSFHSESRGAGPDYPGAWDGVKDAQSSRVCRFVADLFETVRSPA